MVSLPVQIVLTSLLGGGVYYVFILRKNFIEARATVKELRGYRTILSAQHPLASLFYNSTVLAMGRFNLWHNKYNLYADAGWDIHSAISVWPTVQTTLVLADATAIKEVCSSRTLFPKPVELYEPVGLMGRNIVASEGEEWKKYRKISSPAFSDRNNKLVWDESMNIMLNLFDNVWKNGKEISIDNCLHLTVPITLQVLGVAGFGRSAESQDESALPLGHKMSFNECLQIASEDVFLRIAIGNWFPNITNRIRRVRIAFDELESYIKEMIQEKKVAQANEDRFDLLSSLVDANEAEHGALSESELIGNVFVFLVAGHETTAHTLCYTFALLALYQEEQDKLYEHIKSVFPAGRLPTYQDMPLFTQSMAVFYETLRMFPPVIGIPKVAAADTVLVASNAQGQTLPIPTPKGTSIIIHCTGLHYNPRYWKDPEAFNPDRFLEDWPRDAFLAFSGGPRSCLGRKFSETEAIVILTMMCIRYKITVKNEPEFARESFEEKTQRVLKSISGITITPVRVPLTFTRRD